jgi:2-oxoglutarate dehydrogenase E1 component
MLRGKAAVSTPDDFTSGTFEPVIGELSLDPEAVERVLLCSGRVTWDLLAERKKRGDERTAVVRLEQLYPRPARELKAELDRFPNASVVRWVQDEPANQGAWPHLSTMLPQEIEGLRMQLVSRPESSTPSVGQHTRHVEENTRLMQEAFA